MTDIKQRLDDLRVACKRALTYTTELDPTEVHDVAVAALREIKRLEGLEAARSPSCTCAARRDGLPHASWCPQAPTHLED